MTAARQTQSTLPSVELDRDWQTCKFTSHGRGQRKKFEITDFYNSTETIRQTLGGLPYYLKH